MKSKKESFGKIPNHVTIKSEKKEEEKEKEKAYKSHTLSIINDIDESQVNSNGSVSSKSTKRNIAIDLAFEKKKTW